MPDKSLLAHPHFLGHFFVYPVARPQGFFTFPCSKNLEFNADGIRVIPFDMPGNAFLADVLINFSIAIDGVMGGRDATFPIFLIRLRVISIMDDNFCNGLVLLSWAAICAAIVFAKIGIIYGRFSLTHGLTLVGKRRIPDSACFFL